MGKKEFQKGLPSHFRDSFLSRFQSIDIRDRVSVLKETGNFLLEEKRFLPNFFLQVARESVPSGLEVLDRLSSEHIEKHGLKRAYATLQKIHSIVSAVIKKANKNFLSERGLESETNMEQAGGLPFRMGSLDVQFRLTATESETDSGEETDDDKETQSTSSCSYWDVEKDSWEFSLSWYIPQGFSMYCSPDSSDYSLA